MGGWRQARAVAVLPGNVTIVVPALILLFVEGPQVGWGLDGIPAALAALLGVALIVAGFSVWLRTVRLLSRIGGGTLAPWDQTSTLVVEGPYARTRNPMIAAVATLLAGEAAFFGSPWICVWAVLFVALNAAYFALSEEPGLERRFGEEYRAYRRSVPRWVPRRTPWVPR